MPLYGLPPGSIREVYCGIRADLGDADTVAARLATANPSIAVCASALDDGAVSVGVQPNVSLAVAARA